MFTALAIMVGVAAASLVGFAVFVSAAASNLQDAFEFDEDDVFGDDDV